MVLMGDETLSYTDLFWTQYNCPYVWLFYFCFLFTRYILKPNPFFQASLQSAQMLSHTLLLQAYFANQTSLSSSGYLMTVCLVASRIVLLLFLIYTQIHPGPLFLFKWIIKICLSLLTAVPERRGYALGTPPPVMHSDTGKTSWAPSPALRGAWLHTTAPVVSAFNSIMGLNCCIL